MPSKQPPFFVYFSAPMNEIITTAAEITTHARQNLVSRLDGYQTDHAKTFADVIAVIEGEFLPAINRHALVGEARVQGVAILVGVDGDGRLSGVARGADDTDGDLAAVRDEDLGDTRHGFQPTDGLRGGFDRFVQIPRRNVVFLVQRSSGIRRARMPSRLYAAGAQRSGHATSSSRTRCRRVDSDIPTTVEGSPSTRVMNGAPRLSTVNAPATSSGSPVAT